MPNKNKVQAKTLPRTGFLMGTMYAIPWWFTSVGIHVAVLLLLALITAAQLSPTEEHTVTVTIGAMATEVEHPKDIFENIYEPPAIPKNTFSQPSGGTFLLYPGFLPETKDTAIKNSSSQVENNREDFISYLPGETGGIRSRHIGKIRGKSNAMGIGEGGGGNTGNGINTTPGGDNVSETKLTMNSSNAIPSYPPLARQLGQEGKVLLLAEVDEKGLVSKISIVKSSGYELLDESALQTVKNWVFIPATKNGKPIPGTIKIPICFKLT